MLDFLLGAQIDPIIIIICLELVLAGYDLSLAINAKSKVLKIVHIVLTVGWVILAILNLLGV